MKAFKENSMDEWPSRKSTSLPRFRPAGSGALFHMDMPGAWFYNVAGTWQKCTFLAPSNLQRASMLEAPQSRLIVIS